ncbi:MAG: hypothetical protein PHU61_02190 [Candidatus Absconditabacteria bacterium]|nr:hypothetical protein [Candidatus Absconditabacteria bacterium]MDD3868492.1 hypothetical protein [Candidatus Absconditabacteria bacterium]MDD4713912.1 hypothetical protein [Candidatus Absconditabacteria bacterium]
MEFPSPLSSFTRETSTLSAEQQINCVRLELKKVLQQLSQKKDLQKVLSHVTDDCPSTLSLHDLFTDIAFLESEKYALYDVLEELGVNIPKTPSELINSDFIPWLMEN